MAKRKKRAKNDGCLVSLITIPFSLIALMFALVFLPFEFLFEILKCFFPNSPNGYRVIPLQSNIDCMDGHDFEYWCANLLRKNGYQRVKVTQGSGDQGVDIIAYNSGKKYAIQCKRYNQKLGNKPIQEVHTGKTIYHCDIAVVMTNNYFTLGAIEAARATGVQLWDRNMILKMIKNANKT